METRLDRIEKALETLLVGIADLKESQKKTDEQMRRTDARLDRVGKQLADLGLVQGEVAEDLFYRNLRNIDVAAANA
jgi:ribosome assembly protein YihI (activator of Der GTPase)